MNTIKRLLAGRLVPDWRTCWTWFSTHVNLLIAAAIAYVLTDPISFFTFYLQLPADVREFLGPAFGVILFVVTQGLRLWKQHRKGEKPCPSPQSPTP